MRLLNKSPDLAKLGGMNATQGIRTREEVANCNFSFKMHWNSLINEITCICITHTRFKLSGPTGIADRHPSPAGIRKNNSPLSRTINIYDMILAYWSIGKRLPASVTPVAG